MRKRRDCLWADESQLASKSINRSDFVEFFRTFWALIEFALHPSSLLLSVLCSIFTHGSFFVSSSYRFHMSYWQFIDKFREAVRTFLLFWRDFNWIDKLFWALFLSFPSLSAIIQTLVHSYTSTALVKLIHFNRKLWWILWRVSEICVLQDLFWRFSLSLDCSNLEFINLGWKFMMYCLY